MQRKILMNMDTEKFNQNIDWVIAGEVYGSGTITEDVKTHADYQTKKDEITAEYNTYQANKRTPEQIEADKASGNQKLLDLGLTQAEVTALTGYTPPSEE